MHAFNHFPISLICLNQNLKGAAAKALEQFDEAESEAKALHIMTQRMILTREEMVVIQCKIYDWLSASLFVLLITGCLLDNTF